MPDVLMPRLSDTMEEGTLSQWLKNVGDAVHKGDVLAEIETDKATMDLESFEDGVLERLQVHRRLVGLDLGEHIALVNRVSDVLQPLGERALLHGVGQSRHEDLGHGGLLPFEPCGVQNLADHPGQRGGIGQGGSLEGFGVRQRHLGGGNAADWSVQEVEGTLADGGRDLRADAVAEPVVFEYDSPAGLAHRSADRLAVCLLYTS